MLRNFYFAVSAVRIAKKILTLLICFGCWQASKACYADFAFSNGCVGDTIFFNALDGFAAYSWDYGDTTSGSDNVSHDQHGFHIYTQPGTYYVTLFVNIGAEWDYRTNVIHIGPQCFTADFTASCNGNSQITFADYSYGAHDSLRWDFGDAASADLNTADYSPAFHTFTDYTAYNVSLIIYHNGTTDTAMHTVQVDSACFSASILNATTTVNCVNDTVHIYTSHSASVSNVLWNFDDPASGIANISTAFNPSHVFSAPGQYLVSMIYTNGTEYDTLYKLIPVEDCNVWPGDVNADGEVNGEDIFALGIYAGQNGPVRQAASSSFTAQQAASWTSPNFRWMYLQKMVDMKMADCNGDGTINQQDLQVIQANYGMHHAYHNNRSAMLVHKPTDPTLSASVSNAHVLAGSDVTVTIKLGDNATIAQGVYGCSFTLLFDPAKVDAGATVNLNLAWFDSTGNSLLTFYHEDYAAGKLEISFVKTNLVSFNGHGTIGTVTFRTKSTATGAFNISIDGTAKIFNTNMYTGNGGNQEVFSDMFLQGTSATIDNPNAIAAISSSAFSLFPNPNNGKLMVQHERLSDAARVEISNALGQTVYTAVLNSGITTEIFDLSQMANGLYVVSVRNGAGIKLQTEKLLLAK